MKAKKHSATFLIKNRTATHKQKNMNSSAVRALALEYKSLQEEPVEGFRVKLLNDENLFEWSVSVCEVDPKTIIKQ